MEHCRNRLFTRILKNHHYYYQKNETMPSMTICLTFRGGKGHCYVTILNTDIPIDKFERTECHDYKITSGMYDILFQGVSPAGGTTIEVKEGQDILATRKINEAGYFSRRTRITV